MSKAPLQASSVNQQKAIDAFLEVNVLFLGGAMFGGKVQPYTSKVLTPFGFKLLGDVEEGDVIVNPNGSLQKIIKVHPHQDHQFYRVTFDDGTETHCGMEHLWTAWRACKITKKKKTLDKLYGKNDQESLYDNASEVISLEGIVKWMDAGYTVHTPIAKATPCSLSGKRPVDPYVLGVLLGDGCLTNRRALGYTRHTDDAITDSYFISAGYTGKTNPANPYDFKFPGTAGDTLESDLTFLSLMGTRSHTKFIPTTYINSSIEVRWALLQGLMDSDGYVDNRGHMEYVTVSPQLSKDFIHLVRSLGGKVSVNTKQGQYKDSDGTKVLCRQYYRHYIRFSCTEAPFRLQRKIDRYKPATRLSRSIVSVEKASISDGCCITVSDPNRLYVTDDFIVTHNSFVAAMLSTLYATNPDSRIAVFRRTLEQMKKGGAIIDTFKSVYRLLGDSCKLRVGGNPPVGKITKGPGAGEGLDECCKIDFIQMSRDSDMESIRGAAFSLSIIEEALPDFTQEQIEMVIARTRSNAVEQAEGALDCKTLITGNPDPDHFLCDMIKDYYLDEEGYAIQDRCGDIRWYFKYEGVYIWGDSAEEVLELAESEGATFIDRETEKPLAYEDKLKRITSFSFVQLTAKDNPIGMRNNPSYMAQLEAMDEVKKARNLYGNWFIRAENSTYFSRTWLRGQNGERVKRIEDVPDGCVAVRGLDRAYKAPHEGNTSPDYTAFSPLNLKDRDGFYWLLGNYHSDLIDKPYNKADKPVLGRVRRNPGERNNLIIKQAKLDKELAKQYGYSTPILGVAEETGAGSGDYTSLKTACVEAGIKTSKDVKASNVEGKKLLDFLAFSEACENGCVYIVEQTFPPDTLEKMYTEWEIFDGETKSGRTRKDDWVDGESISFNICKEAKRPYKTPCRNITNATTIASGILNND